MAGLQRGGPGVVVQHESGAQPGGAHAHLHAEVEEPRVPVPHAELAKQSADHFPCAGAPGHG